MSSLKLTISSAAHAFGAFKIPTLVATPTLSATTLTDSRCLLFI
jgi:hypothetical protein